MRRRFGTELNPSGFPMESLICVKEDLLRKSPNSLTRTFLNANIKSNFGFGSSARRNINE